MADVKYYHGAGNYADVMNYIASLDDRITIAGDYDLSINGKFLLHLGGGASVPFWIDIYGTTYNGSSIRTGNGYHIYSVMAQDFIFIKIFNEDKSTSNVIVYAEDGNGNYYGGINGSSSTNSINEVTLHKTSAVNDLGFFPKLINCALPIGEIAYSQYAPFTSALTNGTVLKYISALISASDMTVDSVISVGSDNYYCIGSNTLVKIDQ